MLRSSGAGAGPLPTAHIVARFLHAIIQDIRKFVLPELSSGDAMERAYFMALVLGRIAENSDVIPAAFAEAGPDFEASAARAVAIVRAHHAGADAVRGYTEIDHPTARATPADLRVVMLRTVIGQCVRSLCTIPEASPLYAAARAELNAILALEHAWLAAKQAHPPPAANALAKPVSVYDRVTQASVTAYLRERFPKTPEIAATSVEVLAGGRSKKTIFITVTGTDELPPALVMRQDTGMVHIGTSVLQEYPVLNAVARCDLPIPSVYHFEPQTTALGGPFMLMRRLPGKPAGSYPAFENASAALVADIARRLAAIHAIDPAAIGRSQSGGTISQGDQLRVLVQRAWSQWRNMAIEPSPLIEYAFDWMLRQCRRPLLGNRIVHGDYRPHNLLAEGDLVTGILDWEFAHIGDPAEDLAYIRPVVLPIMRWDEFMQHYRAAGGAPSDEATLHLYEVWGLLRLAAMGAGAVRPFMEGSSDDFTQGAGGFFIIPSFEQQLSDLMKQAATLGTIA